MGSRNQALQAMLSQMQQGQPQPMQAAQQLNQIGQSMMPRSIPVSPSQQGLGDDPYMRALSQMYPNMPQSYQPFTPPDMSFLTNPKTAGPLAGGGYHPPVMLPPQGPPPPPLAPATMGGLDPADIFGSAG